MISAISGNTFCADMISAISGDAFCPDMISTVGGHLAFVTLSTAPSQCACTDMIRTIRRDCGRCGLAINDKHRACGGRVLRFGT
ncbi:hypothetical protein D3C72_2164240 [compost metagenome]